MIFVWTDADLDGAGASLMLSWVMGKSAPTKVTTCKTFERDFKSWYNHEGHKYNKIFICDMDVSGCMDLVDQHNIFIFDHHDSHMEHVGKYKKAQTIIKEAGSTTKLIYEFFKDSLSLFKEQKLLIELVDDYDSYQLKYELSADLNKLFWGFSGNRVQKFADAFYNGFTGFTYTHSNIINFYNVKLKETIEGLEIHTGQVTIGDENVKVVSTVASFGLNDVAHNIIETHSADIGIVVNPNSGTVSFRRSKECNIPVNKLASKLAAGGGHEAAAGGTLTDTFFTFCKTLKPI